MWLKVVLLVLQAVIFFERKIQGSALAGSYISLEEVILNKSLTRRQANITAERQYHFWKNILLCKDFFKISQIRKDLFSCRNSLREERLKRLFYLYSTCLTPFLLL